MFSAADPAPGISTRLRVAMVTNIPAPYRLPMYERLAAAPGIDLHVFFCSGREADRAWDLDPLRVPHTFLKERVLRWRDRFIHFNPDIWPRLAAFRPEVIVTTGFNPTHLFAYAHARRHGARHVAMTDGTAMSESRLTAMHRVIRRHVYAHTEAFVGASVGSFALYRAYGVAAGRMFKSHLCANNGAFSAATAAQRARDVDLIFCGRFVAGKLPLFAIEVAAATARRLGRQVRLLLVGSGELEPAMRDAAEKRADDVDAQFAGFARQADLPGHYARARVLLFPTVGDTWGVVANEACAAGVPVIVSPQAGVAGDLVRDGENGRVLPLDVSAWADAAAALLGDAPGWLRMSACSVRNVQAYSYDNAARGLAEAIVFAGSPPHPATAPLHGEVA
ncbi:MAG: glycosyltransferase family 4 protein [Rhizobiales bacterium]|nr:glycosyltransferase family 4 protein [Rhizobacter sp.]